MNFKFTFLAGFSGVTLNEHDGDLDRAQEDIEEHQRLDVEEMMLVESQGEGGENRSSEGGDKGSLSSNEEQDSFFNLIENESKMYQFFCTLDGPGDEEDEVLRAMAFLSNLPDCSASGVPKSNEGFECLNIVQRLADKWSELLIRSIALVHPQLREDGAALLLTYVKEQLKLSFIDLPSFELENKLQMAATLARWLLMRVSSRAQDSRDSDGSAETLPYQALSSHSCPISHLCLDHPSLPTKLELHKDSQELASMQNNWPNLSPDSLFKPLRPGMNPTALQRLCGNMFLQLVSHLPPARHFLHEDGQLLQNTFRSSIHHLLCLLMQASRASQEISLQDIVKLTVEILFRLKLRFLLGMDQKIDDHATILEVARMMLFSKKEPLLAEDPQQNRTLGLTAGENKMIHLVSTIWARPWPAYQPGHADEGEMENLLQGTFADFFLAGEYSLARLFSATTPPFLLRLVPSERIVSFNILTEELWKHSDWYMNQLVCCLNHHFQFYKAMTR